MLFSSFQGDQELAPRKGPAEVQKAAHKKRRKVSLLGCLDLDKTLPQLWW